MKLYQILAVAALTLHLAWILWVMLGWLLTRNRPWLRWLHIASLVYGVLIETLLWPCPLTIAENWFLRRAGLRTYSESFLIHYLDALVYPDVSQRLLTGCAVAVCLGILGIYLLRFRHRHTTGW